MMRYKFILIGIPIIVLGFILLPARALAQAPVPHHKETYIIDTGRHNNRDQIESLAFREVIQVPDATWLRLHFSDYDLGEHSYLLLTSLQDGGEQRLDSDRLAQWHNSTAYFNGDAITLELHVAPGETGIFIQLAEVTVGERVSMGGSIGQTETVPTIESICGTEDNRVPNEDKAIGRLMPVGCTAWLVSNGALLSAGHCVRTYQETVVQFNVPDSLSNGTPVNPPPEDQYPVSISGTGYNYNGVGDDWAVYHPLINSNTERLAVHMQKEFYRMSRDDKPSQVRITGYGVDYDPVGSWGYYNSSNQTLQTHTGSYGGEIYQGASDVYLSYTVDTQGGNSGSPVINPANKVTLGIHTNGGCTSTSGSNKGTGFENDALEYTLQTFPGPEVSYVDNNHPTAKEQGTIFRPYDTVLEGTTDVVAGGIVSIVTGSYDETLVIEKAMLLEAPVGTVVIGD